MKWSIINLFLTLVVGVAIPPSVINQAEKEGMAQFLIQLVPAELKPSQNLHEDLNRHAVSTQKGFVNLLSSLKKDGQVTQFQSYSISNTIAVVGTKNAVEKLAKQEGVMEISSNQPFQFSLPQKRSQLAEWDGKTPHWSLTFINATNLPSDVVNNAKKLVYANADTGVDYSHVALAKNYLGNRGNGEYDHNYSWWDAVKSSRLSQNKSTYRSCGINSQKPCDDSDHGSHSISTTIGGMNLGVSPSSKWMACRNMNQGEGSPETYLSCLQFLMAPTDLNGKNPRPELRPHVIGNSYGCPSSEGCSKNTFQIALKSLKAAGIFMSVSAGNEGYGGCSSINDPPATDENSFSVASSGYKTMTRSGFSSMGPVASRKNALDVTAPGSSITGAVPGNRYAVMSGTSMASPHVSGAALLVMAACPSLERKVDQVAEILRNSATPIYSQRRCGSDSNTQHPNNEYGYGVINVAKAISLCKKISS